MLTHRNIVVNVLQTDAASHCLHDADTTVVSLPFFHIYGFVVIGALGLWSRATLVVMPKFELEPYLDLVERYRATLLHVVPPVIVALAKQPSVAGRDFSSVRKLFSGAAPLGADVIEQCMPRVGCVVQQGYGLTETSPATHITSDDPVQVGIAKERTDLHRLSRYSFNSGFGEGWALYAERLGDEMRLCIHPISDAWACY